MSGPPSIAKLLAERAKDGVFAAPQLMKRAQNASSALVSLMTVKRTIKSLNEDKRRLSELLTPKNRKKIATGSTNTSALVAKQSRRGRRVVSPTHLMDKARRGETNLEAVVTNVAPDLSTEYQHKKAVSSLNVEKKKQSRKISTAQKSPTELDCSFYRIYYPEMSDKTDDQIVEHYLKNGRRKNQFASTGEALAHFEKQNGPLPADFDENFYLDINRDVKSTFSIPRGGALHYLKYGRQEGRSYKYEVKEYDEHLLNLLTNRIHDLPSVIVDHRAPTRINILVPAFDFTTMSAGFFGVFQVGRFIKQCGFSVRLVMFDNFYWNEAEFRKKLLNYPDMENLFDELEIEYIGSRAAPLIVSPFDNCVATVWYSAYFAEKIMHLVGSRPFLYLIQDYETNFFSGGSLFSFADESYNMNYNALFSSKTLQDTFLDQEIGIFKIRWPKFKFFYNACASRLISKEVFVKPLTGKKRLAFYSRPSVDRNMFELGALALCHACRVGILNPCEWEFYGVGIGNVVINLGGGVTLKQLPRMNLRDYQDAVATFDLGLCLMASPHPSLLPFDLAGSGALVVTNTFGKKTRKYLTGISGNIIARRPILDQIVSGLREAARRSNNRSKRFDDALTMRYPSTWKQTFGDEHRDFIADVFSDSRPRTYAI